MMPPHDNDSTAPAAVPPAVNPHGHAALLLVESLIHGLCENATLSVNEAVEIAERAANVQSEEAEAADGAGAPLWRSHALLQDISASLKIDGGRPSVPRSV